MKKIGQPAKTHLHARMRQLILLTGPKYLFDLKGSAMPETKAFDQRFDPRDTGGAGENHFLSLKKAPLPRLKNQARYRVLI